MMVDLQSDNGSKNTHAVKNTIKCHNGAIKGNRFLPTQYNVFDGGKVNPALVLFKLSMSCLLDKEWHQDIC